MAAAPAVMKQKEQTESQRELADTIIREQSKLAADRANFNTLFREVAIRICPSQAQFFDSAQMNGQTEGATLTNDIYDSTGASSLGRFAAIMDSVLTPHDSTWHHIRPSDDRLLKDRPTALWFEEVTRILFRRRYAPNANFISQNFMDNEALGAFGNGALFVDDLYGGYGLRYKHVHLSEIYFAENHQGIVDKVYRYFQLTARQAAQKWGVQKLPPKIAAALPNDPEKKFAFIHRVAKKESWDPERRDYKGKPFSSCYVAVEDKWLMQEGGYRTLPYAVSRYKQSANEVYGRSPAMEVLPSLKTLNEMKKQVLRQGQRVLDPVLLSYDDGLLDTFSLASGALNPGGVTADGRPLIHTLPTGQIMAGKELMDDERTDVKDAFLVTLFQILTENPQMTATEALERAKEKGMLISPTLGRQYSEKHGSMIERELDVLMAQNLLPPMPPALLEAGGAYTIVYDSPLTRQQRAGEASGLMRMVEFARDTFNITQDRSILRPFKWKTIVPDLSQIEGVPARWMNSEEEIAQMEQLEAQAQQEQTMIQAAPAAAAMVKADAASRKAGPAP